MYYEHFGFNEPPFSISPDPRFLYMSARHRDALAHLVYGAGENGGFVLLTGAVGTGKTTLIRSLLKQELANVELAFCLHSGLSAFDFIASILDELQVSYDDKATSLKPLIDALNCHLLATHAAGKETVLIIDEGQNLSREVLEQVRLLTNLETDAKKLLRIILVGQEELLHTINRNDLRQLSQRITTRYHLTPLNPEEVADYIAHRIKTAKSSPSIFSAAATRQVHRLTKGVPRLINIVCDRALLAAYNDDADTVQAKHVVVAATETLPQAHIEPHRQATPKLALIALLGLGMITAGGYAYLHPEKTNNFIHNISKIKEKTGVVQNKEAAKIVRPENNAATTTSAQETTQEIAQNTTPSTNDEISALVQPPEEPPQTVAPLQTTVSRETATDTKKRQMNVFDIAVGQSAGVGLLLRRWGLDSNIPIDKTACQFAETQRMTCLMGKGTLAMVTAINRPTLLEMMNANGNIVGWVAVNKLNNEYFSATGQEQQFITQQLLRWWSGNFIVLLKKPNVSIKISPGFEGEQVLWLRQRIAAAAGKDYANISSSQLYDDALVEQVKQFQRSRLIDIDGIIGDKTLTYLFNVIADEETPTLITNP